ncbi:hypothetical protein [Nocardioides jejuensis]|uniref:Uncharacterized protein n=1 Tax=Nocardioides jejuensis TaxID=2502782 RepID=A0A4R1CIP5_9ACTN|nr:hypothetical protein [Nocardioides jejuensis]TCJ30891.1 hypothetical protein EPD65_02310 [Nocardioides jejuensis]
MTDGWEDAGHGNWRAPAPWWKRVWVVTPLLVVVGAGAVAASPDLRHQVALSTTRVDPQFVELSFADETLARACLHTSQGSGFVIAVRSHLDAPAMLHWTATVSAGRSVGRGPAPHGDLDTRPGETVDATVRYAAPGRSYTVTINLTGRPEHLVLQCGEGGTS